MVNAPTTPGLYELAGNGSSFNALTDVFEVQGDGSRGPLTMRFDVVSPRAPTPVTGLTLVSKSSTTINIKWVEGADTSVAGHRVYVNGTRYGTALSANALAATITGRAAATTYTVTVRRYNVFGESGDSNVLSVTTSSASGGSVPTAPTGLSRSALTATGVTLSWSDTTDATVTSHHVYVNGVAFGGSLSATATTTAVTGLTASTAYTVYVTRSNSSGESPASNTITFTTPASGGGGTGGSTAPYLYGVSNSKYSHPGTWQVMRIYAFSAVSDAVAAGATTVALSDDDLVKKSGGQASANAFRTALTNLYNAHPNLKVYYASGNELDRKGPASAGETGTWTTYGTTYAKLRAVADDFVAAGKFLKMGVDLTQHQIDLWLKGKTTVEDDIRTACLPYLDFLGFSMYAPGRQTTPINYNAFDTYIDRCFDLAVAWGISDIHCWEFGIPADTNTTHPSSTNETVTATGATLAVKVFGRSSLLTLNLANASAVRPAYVAYAARYIADRCADLGFSAPQLCYWDSDTGVTNTFESDPAGTSPTTLQSWRNWQTYATGG